MLQLRVIVTYTGDSYDCTPVNTCYAGKAPLK